ncbi:MAG: hypothetical protein J2O46_03320, partial [Nocardioides sp.]|nr:hypothetical protein [Nocardioides sp.]
MRVSRGIAALALSLPPIVGMAAGCGATQHDTGPHMGALVKAYANDDFSKVAFADTKAATVDKDYKRIAGDLLSRFGAP